MTVVKGWDMARYWRLVSVQGLASGTFWVTRPDEERRGLTHVYTVDVILWDEVRSFGRGFTTNDVVATVIDGVPDLGTVRGRWTDLTEEDVKNMKSAVLAAANAAEWEPLP